MTAYKSHITHKFALENLESIPQNPTPDFDSFSVDDLTSAADRSAGLFFQFFAVYPLLSVLERSMSMSKRGPLVD